MTEDDDLRREKEQKANIKPHDLDAEVRRLRIQRLNDRLRCTGKGGQVLVTRGICSLPHDQVLEIARVVAAFDAFTHDNDPYGEHDCAVVEVGDQTVIWKIDYYDRDKLMGSPDPADPRVTHRVLTIMLAEEY
jgi:hypothetical protein